MSASSSLYAILVLDMKCTQSVIGTFGRYYDNLQKFQRKHMKSRFPAGQIQSFRVISWFKLGNSDKFACLCSVVWLCSSLLFAVADKDVAVMWCVTVSPLLNVVIQCELDKDLCLFVFVFSW